MKQPQYFVESIWYGEKRLFFSFREIIIPNGLKFCVVTLDQSQLIVFEMRMDKNGVWKIVPPFPDWINGLEQRLVDIIEARLS